MQFCQARRADSSSMGMTARFRFFGQNRQSKFKKPLIAVFEPEVGRGRVIAQNDRLTTRNVVYKYELKKIMSHRAYHHFIKKYLK